jgi:hypothetical protein
MADIMEFILPDVFRAAVEVAPAHRATLNQRKQNALFIYRFAPFMRVSAVVIFLHLFMSGDVELHPGPQGEHYFCWSLYTILSSEILLANFMTQNPTS